MCVVKICNCCNNEVGMLNKMPYIMSEQDKISLYKKYK